MLRYCVKILVIGLMSFSSLLTNAQDMHFTQYYAAPLYLNPAFTGSNACHRVATSYRMQWMGVPNGYKSHILSYDHYVNKHKIGLGFLMGNDVAGSGDLRKLEFSPMLGYETPISREFALRAGFQPTIGNVSVDYNKLLFGDQIARGGGVPTLERQPRNTTYVDFGAGILLYNGDAWLGSSFYHLVKPMEGIIGARGESQLPFKMSVHGGYKFLVDKNELDESRQESISFTFNYRGQKEFDQLDLSFYYSKGPLTGGLMYRGIPIFKAYEPGYGNSDAISLLIGVKSNRFYFGYSYDFTISQLTNVDSGGAHELSVSIQFCDPRYIKRRLISVPCPKL